MRDVHYNKVLKDLKNKFKLAKEATENSDNAKCSICNKKIITVSRISDICTDCAELLLK